MDSNISAWTAGGSIFTFASLFALFIAVAAALYVMYTKPGVAPGHRTGVPERPAIYSPRPGLPATGPNARSAASSSTDGAAATTDRAGE